MKILYRHHRGGLDESMATVKEFDSLKDCFEYVAKEFEFANLDIDDICVSYYCYDERIDWETYIVCDCSETTLKQYHCPQGLGFLTFK